MSKRYRRHAACGLVTLLADGLPIITEAAFQPGPDVEAVAVDGIEVRPDEAEESLEMHFPPRLVPLDLDLGRLSLDKTS